MSTFAIVCGLVYLSDQLFQTKHDSFNNCQQCFTSPFCLSIHVDSIHEKFVARLATCSPFASVGRKRRSVSTGTFSVPEAAKRPKPTQPGRRRDSRPRPQPVDFACDSEFVEEPARFVVVSDEQPPLLALVTQRKAVWGFAVLLLTCLLVRGRRAESSGPAPVRSLQQSGGSRHCLRAVLSLSPPLTPEDVCWFTTGTACPL